MNILSREELSQLSKPTTSYRGSSAWGRSPNVICAWCRRATDNVVIRMKGATEQLVCLHCIEQGRK